MAQHGGLNAPSTLSAVYSDVSRHSEISIQCYLRTEEPKRGGDGIADDRGNDLFMGGVRFMPDFDDPSLQEQWYDLAGGSGRIQIGVAFKPSTVRRPLGASIFSLSRRAHIAYCMRWPSRVNHLLLTTLSSLLSSGRAALGRCMCRVVSIHAHI